MPIVTTADDTVNPNDGVLSLREALAQADGDTITFASGVKKLVLTQGQLTSTFGELTIDGGSGVTIDANGQSRVFELHGPTRPDALHYAALANLTIIGGRTTGAGGGILAGGEMFLSLSSAPSPATRRPARMFMAGGSSAVASWR